MHPLEQYKTMKTLSSLVNSIICNQIVCILGSFSVFFTTSLDSILLGKETSLLHYRNVVRWLFFNATHFSGLVLSADVCRQVHISF